MSPLARRLKAAIGRLGDEFTIGGAAHRGVIGVLSHEQALAYLTQAEIDAAPRPLRLAVAPFDDTASAGNVVSWDGQSLVIKRAFSLRYRGTAVARILIFG